MTLVFRKDTPKFNGIGDNKVVQISQGIRKDEQVHPRVRANHDIPPGQNDHHVKQGGHTGGSQQAITDVKGLALVPVSAATRLGGPLADEVRAL